MLLRVALLHAALEHIQPLDRLLEDVRNRFSILLLEVFFRVALVHFETEVLGYL